mmetsp:Transcript_82/g.140  ORF Transcript_82/g.140 Transcript_82/m.140 type:complete len:582 (-) Transcript_82:41-1786(-)
MESAYSDFLLEREESHNIAANVVEISLDCLQKETEIATGDPTLCKECSSLLNSFSQLKKQDSGYLWVCEFCGTQNLLDLEEGEIPSNPEVTYIFGPVREVEETKQRRDDAASVVFCVDISGSMCITKPVQGNLNLKTTKKPELADFIDPGDEDQRIPGENRDVTYISRLDCVQGAIESQLKELKEVAPNKRVGLVTFSGDVKVIGDGSFPEVNIAGDRLNQTEAIKKVMDGYRLQSKIEDNSEYLIQKVIELEEGGPTALGPGLYASLILASQGAPGSKVIICTDGIANIGVGNLEDEDNEEFYEEVGALATELGVKISVISMEGEESRLEALSPITEQTGGDVIKVAPEKISEEFANILADEVIATHVKATVTLHKALKFYLEEEEDLVFNGSRLVKFLGNATPSSLFSFQYGIKTRAELEAQQTNSEELKQVPLQAVLEYQSMQGMKCLRVVSKVQKVSFDKSSRRARADIMARAGTHQASKMVQKGRFQDARNVCAAWEQEMESCVQNTMDLAHIQAYSEFSNQLQQGIDDQECLERQAGLVIDESSKDPEERKKMSKARKKLYTDNLTKVSRKKSKK